ncbi:hypothetical protein ACFE04_022589 [Oxalis oulophora]
MRVQNRMFFHGVVISKRLNDLPEAFSQLAIENAVNNPDEPMDNLQDVDLGRNDLLHDDINIDILQDVAHPSRERHSSDHSIYLGGDDFSHGDMNIDIPQDAAHPSRKRHSSDPSREDETQQLMPSIFLAVPCSRRTFRNKALVSPITEVIHDEEEAYSSSTHDDFLEEPSSIGIEGSSFIGFTTSSSSVDSALTLMDLSRDTPSVPSSLLLLVSTQTIISMTTTNTSSELPKALVSTSQLSSSCATSLTTTMSISHERPHMSLSLMPLSSLSKIASSTTLSTLSKPSNMPLSLSPPTSLCAVTSLTILSTSSELPNMLLSLSLLSLPSLSSHCIIVSLTTLSTSSELPSMPHSSSPLTSLLISTQSTAISTPVTVLGSLITCIPDVSTTLPRAPFTQSSSIMITPSIMSSSSMLALLSLKAALGNIPTYTFDASTSLPRALLTQSLSTVIVPSTMSSSVIPFLSSYNASVFSSSTFAKAVLEAIYVVAMTRNTHSDEVCEADLRCRLGECYSNKFEASLAASKKREADLRERVVETLIKEMEEEKISRDNEIESLCQKRSKFEWDVKRAKGDKDVNISSFERALARVREFFSQSVDDIGNDVEPSNDP